MRRRPCLRAVVFCAAACLAAEGAKAQLQIVSTSPPPESRGAGLGGPITIQFNVPIVPDNLGAGSLKVSGRWSGPHSGTFAVQQGGTTIAFTPSTPFSAGEPVFVELMTSVHGAGGVTLPAPVSWQFWADSFEAALNFTLAATLPAHLPGENGIVTYGAYAGDLNRDGWPDLSAIDELGNDVRVFMNDGQGGYGGFTIHPLPPGSGPSPSEGADLNGDGWVDLVVACIAGGNVAVLLNAGGTYLAPVVYAVGSAPRGIAILDADGDGDLDLVTANRLSSDMSLLRNNGNGTFLQATTFEGGVGGETGVAAADWNGDGTLDLFVAGFATQNVGVLIGNGNGTFTPILQAPVGGAPWSIATGDLNGDGLPDCAVATSSTGQAVVLLQNGQGGFQNAVAYPSGPYSTAIDIADIDGDGDLDMVASSFGGGTYTIYQNLGYGAFVIGPVLHALQAGSCAVLVDTDGDHRLDVVGVDELADNLYVWKSSPLAVQPCQASACLLVNGGPPLAGFIGQGTVPASLAAPFVVTVIGAALQPYALLSGAKADPGMPTVAGTLNVVWDPSLFVFTDPAFVTSVTGIGFFTASLPASTPLGLHLVVQGLVVNPADFAAGVTLTSPAEFVTVP